MMDSLYLYLALLSTIPPIYYISYKKDKNKTIYAIKKAYKQSLSGLVILIIAMFFTGILYIIMDPEMVKTYLSSAAFPVGILIATLLGYLLPGPRYVIYPVARFLLDQGAAVSVILVLIFSQQLIDVPDGMFIEIKMLGWRFFVARLLISTALCIIAGLIGEIIFTALL